MKAVLSNRIYLNTDAEIRNTIIKSLTYSIPSAMPGGRPEIICDVVALKNDILSIPIGRVDLIPEHFDIFDKRALVPYNFENFNATLRESQQIGYDLVDDSYIINAKPGWGKTFTGLSIASKLGQKTLIVVHTVALRDQWEEEIEKVLGIKPGIIGSSRYEPDNPIVLGNVQTLKKYAQKHASDFGLVIID